MQEGIVIKSTGSWYEVRNEDGEVVLCRLRGKIRLDGIRTTNPVAVGDKVIFEKENNKETSCIATRFFTSEPPGKLFTHAYMFVYIHTTSVIYTCAHAYTYISVCPVGRKL